MGRLPIVLASASPRRRALLEALGMRIEVRPSAADETLGGDPAEAATRNAVAKRDGVAKTLDSPALIIAADTVVVIGDCVLGKPRDLEDARAMLRQLSGATHRVITGVAVIDTDSGKSAADHETTEVTFCALTEAEIDCFVNAVNPVDRAGAYTVDGPGSLLVARYNGCYQNVLGLPMVRLNALVRTIGHDLFDYIEPERARFL
ncbi:MAG: Maf family protein [Candidatus Hydrogenedentota bacterium]